MSELDTMLRGYFDDIAPSIEVEQLKAPAPDRPRRTRLLRPLAVAMAAAVVVLILGLVTVLLGRWWDEPIVDEPITTTLPPQPTTAPTTTAPRMDVSVWGSSEFFPGRVDAVTWVGDRFVAVGERGGGEGGVGIWTSVDGLEWSEASGDLDGFPNMGGVTAGGPGLVAVGGDYTGWPDERPDAAVWTSADGTAWERVPHVEEVFGSGADHMSSVLSVGTELLAVGGVCTDPAGPCPTQPTVWRSANGVRWTRTVLDEVGSMEAVLPVGSGLIAVGNAAGPSFDQDAAVWISDEGDEWTQVSPDPDVFGGPGNQWIEAAAVLDSRIVAAGNSWTEEGGSIATIWTTGDGTEWVRVILGEGALYDVTVAGSQFVAVGGYGDAQLGRVWASTDGEAWTPLDSPDLGSTTPTAIAAGPERVVMFTSGRLWVTSPPEAWKPTSGGPAPEEVVAGPWTRRTHPETLGDARITDAIILDDRLVAVGARDWPRMEDGGIWLSDDLGVTWRPAGSLPEVENTLMSGLTLNGPGLIAVGSVMEGSLGDPRVSDGAIWTSSDGERWEETSDPLLEDIGLYGVASSPEVTVAVGRWEAWGAGHGAAILVSTDGTTWTRVPDDSLFVDTWMAVDVVWTGTEFIAVGSYDIDLDPPREGFVVWRSRDGTTWTREEIPHPDWVYVLQVAANGDTVAVGAGCGVWVWTEGEWSFRTPTALGGPAQNCQYFAHDVAPLADGILVAFGGFGGDPARTEVWNLVGDGWSRLSDDSDLFEGHVSSIAALTDDRFVVFGNVPALAPDPAPTIVWTWAAGE